MDVVLLFLIFIAFCAILFLKKHIMEVAMITIETASAKDAPRLLEIYAPYVKNTAITFEYDVPTLENFSARIQNTLKKYPYLVLKDDGKIMGYAYAGVFKDRAAYNRCCELSVYLDVNAHRRGYGKMLYAALEKKLREMGIENLYACIAYPVVEDEYLTKNSAEFHEHLGFTTVGHFHRCGYKFGRHYDMIWMEKLLESE